MVPHSTILQEGPDSNQLILFEIQIRARLFLKWIFQTNVGHVKISTQCGILHSHSPEVDENRSQFIG